MLNLLQHILGLNDPGSAWYLAWSGFVGDLPLFFAIFLWYRHNKCHKCYRLGHHVPNVHYPVCRKHKPGSGLPETAVLKGFSPTLDGVSVNIRPNLDGTISPVDPDKPITTQPSSSSTSPVQLPSPAAPDWEGPDTIYSTGIDGKAPDVEYDKPPQNRYGESVDI